MLTLGLITGALGSSYSFLLVRAMLQYACENSRQFSYNRKRIKRLLCDVVAICGALACLLSCVQLMAHSLSGLLG